MGLTREIGGIGQRVRRDRLFRYKRPGKLQTLEYQAIRPHRVAVREMDTEFLFSYGTLQLEAVQMATFGRALAGVRDVLPGFELTSLTIDDAQVVAISGKSQHTMARFTGRASDVVPGTVFSVTPEEIQNADRYEVAAVRRVAVVLQSGQRAWAYVDARYAPSDSPPAL